MPPRAAESRAPAAARSGAARPRGARHAWPERSPRSAAQQPSPAERLRRALPPPLPAPPPRRPAKAAAGGGGGGTRGGLRRRDAAPRPLPPAPGDGDRTGNPPRVPGLGGDRDRDCPGKPTPGCWGRDCPGERERDPTRKPGLGGGISALGAGTERGPGDRDRPGTTGVLGPVRDCPGTRTGWKSPRNASTAPGTVTHPQPPPARGRSVP